MTKLRKTAKELDIFFRVVFWLFIVNIVLTLGNVLNVHQNDIVFELMMRNNPNFPADQYSTLFYLSELSKVLLYIAACYAVTVVRTILKPMKAGEPFHSDVVTNTKKLGWIALAYGIIDNILGFVLLNFLTNSDLLAASGINVSRYSSFNASFIVVTFLLFLFSYIFRYGEQLQQLSDETL